MIFSVEQNWSFKETVTASGPSENTIDLGETGTVLGAPVPLVRDIGKGVAIPLDIQLTADAADDADTMQVELQVSPDQSDWTTVATSSEVTGGSAGQRFGPFYVPQGTNERYVRLNYTVSGTSPSYEVVAGPVLGDQTSTGVPGA